MNSDSGLLAPVWAGTPAADLTADEAWLQAMLDVEVALANTQAGLGVIPDEAAAVIAEAAHAERIDLATVALDARETGNPVVSLVKALTAEVARIDVESAEHVHRGGTSQDILDSAAMLICARVLDRVAHRLTDTADALADLADRHRGTLMAGRTLTQHAVPITFGLKASGWLVLVLDALDRVRAVRDHSLFAQLGGAAGTLASYLEYAGGGVAHGTELSRRFAAELGLPEAVIPWHALRTPYADLGAVCSFVTVALGKIALDVQGMSRTEVGEVAEPGGEGRGASSAMPQKRNPVLATLLVSAARQAPHHAAVLTQAVLAEDERAPGAWQSEWQSLRECLRLAGGAAEVAAELTAGMSVFPERMRANLDLTGGAIVSERVNVALAPLLGKAEAKELLGRIARDARPFEEALAAELTHLDAARLEDLLDPARYLGYADAYVDRALARHRAAS
jgi:3-carboxy-cis,cis-muconate cycloisomerase